MTFIRGFRWEATLQIIEKMLEGAEVRLNVDYLKEKENLRPLGKKVVYTGPVDAYFDYCFGELEYRTVRFETEILDTDNYQGKQVVIIQSMKFHIQESLSISILNLEPRRRPLFPESIR